MAFFQRLALCAIALFLSAARDIGPPRSEIVNYVQRHIGDLYIVDSLEYKTFLEAGGRGRVSVSGRLRLNQDLFAVTGFANLRAELKSQGIDDHDVETGVNRAAETGFLMKRQEVALSAEAGSKIEFTANLHILETVKGFEIGGNVAYTRHQGVQRSSLTDRDIVFGSDQYSRMRNDIFGFFRTRAEFISRSKINVDEFLRKPISMGVPNYDVRPPRFELAVKMACSQQGQWAYEPASFLRVGRHWLWSNCNAEFRKETYLANAWFNPGAKHLLGILVYIYDGDTSGNGRVIQAEMSISGSRDAAIRCPENQYCRSAFVFKWVGNGFLEDSGRGIDRNLAPAD